LEAVIFSLAMAYRIVFNALYLAQEERLCNFATN